MLSLPQARASARLLIRTSAIGAAIGAASAGAYVAAAALRPGAVEARPLPLREAASVAITDTAMRGRDGIAEGLRSADGEPIGAAYARGARLKAFTVAARPFHDNAGPDSARELDCLTQAVYFEARGEGDIGQAAVAQVVLNRVRHPAFPKSVCAVVYQGAQTHSCQFSFACDGSARQAHQQAAWRRAQGVAARALAGSVLAEVGNATHFHAARIGPQWAGMLRVAQVGQHVFYRFAGRGGLPGAFTGVQRAEAAQPKVVYASLLPEAAVQFMAVGSPTPLQPSAAAQPVAGAALAVKSAPPAAEAPAAQAPVTAS